MTLAWPQALLLLVPVALILWRQGLPGGPAGPLRALVMLFAIVALARPSLMAGGGGRDVVVLVDRSRSMPAGADSRAEELLRNVEAQRGPSDRVAVVAFGREARIERGPSAAEAFGGFRRAVDGDASDLAAALDLARELLPREREGRVLVLSDGLSTGGDARAAVRRLAERGVPVDFRHLAREAGADVAVEALELPGEVREAEPFQFTAVVRAATARRVKYALRRGGALLARGELDLVAGPNRVAFRDRLDRQGVAEYSLELLDADDPTPENDRGRGVVRVRGVQRVLVVRADGRESALARAIRESGLAVSVTDAPPRTLEALDDVGVVVLENVPASLLGEQGLQVLATFVRDAGGGLLVTGGRRSYGEGGYHRSALDGVLPVSMELREEQRKAAIALGISMDRSGSMSMTTPEGLTKMQVAAEGAVAALQLLSRSDEAVVWVVDTRAHEVFPLTPVEHGLSLDLVASVRSEGGGIYVGKALEAAADELGKSTKATRHLILFADAADSEEPGEYRRILRDMRRAGMTVSVIGLGSEQDPDAKLLEEIAQLGGGRIYFADEAAELPRLFSEETIVVSRSSFIDEPTALVAAPDLALLGPGDARAGLPKLGGYNLTYVRPQANVALRSGDENAAPVLAFWRAGAGQAAAFTGEADGEFSGGLAGWPGYRSLFTRVVRHLMPASELPGVLAKARREGHELLVTVEGDDVDASSTSLTIVSGDGASAPIAATLRKEGANRLSARVPVTAGGSYFPVVRLGPSVVRVAPVAQPYPAEFEPRDTREGRALLEDLAHWTGGVERLSVDGLFSARGSAPGRRPVATWFVVAALLLLVVEVAVRRLGIAWPAWSAWKLRRNPVPVRVTSAAQIWASREADKSTPAAVEIPAESVRTEAPPPAPEPPKSGVVSALDRARERANKRLR